MEHDYNKIDKKWPSSAHTAARATAGREAVADYETFILIYGI